MEKKFNNRDFEQFVKQNADQYRMFPSEKVWKNIHHSLHTRRRWLGIGLALLTLTVGTVTWVMLSPHKKNNTALAYKPGISSKNNQSDQNNGTPPVLVALVRPNTKINSFITTADNLQRSLFSSGLTINPNNNYEENEITAVSPIIAATIAIPTTLGQIKVLANPSILINTHQPLLTKKPATDIFTLQDKNNDLVLTENNKSDIPVADYKTAPENKDIYPLSIESVVNSYKYTRNKRRLSWEVFFTPTVSYRKLNENKAFINSAQINNNAYTTSTDINSLVTHKPDMGLQVGFNAGYPISKSLKIVGGFQFNISKYDIRASFSSSEVATIALNTGGGANSVSTISNYRNFSGSKADWLRNLYFSASVPVGLELKLSGNNKTQLGIIGTIQPTYILSNRAYLLSTDYKNYVEVPSLIRKWNTNTSFEIFAGFSTGKINWRAGPLVRYQIRSSFLEKYPVKEHLFDFGLKLGVMLKK
jgi:hypothetical protein